jgi:hypothetical protein
MMPLLGGLKNRSDMGLTPEAPIAEEVEGPVYKYHSTQ